MTDHVMDSVAPKLHDRIANIVAERGLPGAAVGVVRDQELAWSAGFGFADIGAERRPDEHTLFRVGSITKTFTATAIVQLRDEGKLSLDDPLTHHLPEFGAVRNRFGTVEDVTLRRRLTHRSGLVGEPPHGHWETLTFPSMEEIIASLPQIEVVIPPDSAFKYSNLAFALLGEVVTRVSGRPYVDYVRTAILAPLGMTSSAFALTDTLRTRMATGYDPHPFEDEQSPSPHPLINGETAAGQLYSSVHDLARWIALQFRTEAPAREETQVLKGPSLEEMHRPLYMEPGWNAGYCLSWMAIRRGENVYLGHGGGIHGFISQILFNKPHRTGAIALTNGSGPGAPEIAVETMEMLMTAANEAPRPAPRQRPVPTPPEWKRFLGRYVPPRGGIPLQVECRQGALVVTLPAPPAMPAPPPTHLEATDRPHVFLAKDGRWAGEPVTFRLAEDGTVAGFDATGFPFRKLVEAAG